MRTLQNILIDANAYLDLEASVPTGTELTTRANYANRLVWEASAVAQFSEFHTIYEVLATTASIPLQSNFREFMTAPRQRINGGWQEYEEIKPLERFAKEPDDKYFFVLGNPSAGYTAVFNGLQLNATLSMDFQRYPSGLATLTDVCELPDPMYVVTGIESLVLQSRSDERFPTVDADKNRRLQNMVGREMKQPGGGINQVRKIGSASYSLG